MGIELNALSRAKILAQEFFTITLPASEEELKASYRKAALEAHPDRQGGNTEKFKEIQRAYEFIIALREFPEILVQESSGHSLTTTSGIPIHAFGKGLGNMKNGVQCGTCCGEGYTIHTMTAVLSKITCTTCKGRGSMLSPCKYCKGSGKGVYSSGKTIICKPCKGSGKSDRIRGLCRTCIGGFIEKKGTAKYARICHMCDGKGEVEIFNPVIPKGVLS